MVIFNAISGIYTFIKILRIGGDANMMSYEPLFNTMRKKGITSYRLQKMGFNRATYYAIKSGKSVSTNTIEHLCKLLQCRVEEVIEYVEE